MTRGKGRLFEGWARYRPETGGKSDSDLFFEDHNYSGSEVQGSTFRVKDKDGIEDPKSS